MRVFATMLLALTLAACGGDSVNSVPIPSNVLGTWTLQTIGGESLPFILDQAGEDKLELMEATVTATADGNFSTSSTERTTIAGEATSRSYSEVGTYSTDGSLVTFTFNADNSRVIGTIDGDALTFTGGGVAVVYRRR